MSIGGGVIGPYTYPELLCKKKIIFLIASQTETRTTHGTAWIGPHEPDLPGVTGLLRSAIGVNLRQ
jgi:hypothetical protein